MILDVFKIVFEADTGKADKGIKKVDKSTDELVDSMKKADKQADKTGHALGQVAAKAAAAMGAALAAIQATQGAFERADSIRAIEQTANAIGTSVQDVDAFSKAMVIMGSDAQGARDSLTDMAESIGEAMNDIESGRGKTFTALGVSLKDAKGGAIDAVEGMLRLADSVQGMSKAEAVFNIKQLGITDNRTVEAILKGRKELERLIRVQKETVPLTKEQIENARKMTEAMGKWRGAFGNASNSIYDALIPSLTKLVDFLTNVADFLSDHKDAVVGFFIAIAGVLTAVYLPAMVKAAIATIAMNLPLIASIALVAAFAAGFALLYDDVMNFLDGNDSLIGQINENYPIIRTIVYGLLDAFHGFADGVVASFNFILEVWNTFVSTLTAGADLVNGAIGAVVGLFGGGGTITVAQKQIGAAGRNPMNSTTSAGISNHAATRNESNVQVGQVVVNTQATDAKGVAKGMGGALKSQLKGVQAESATGIAR